MTVKTHRLANGFRIATEHMPSMKSASVGVWVEAGARHERASQNGIAHFLEHMAFKGTKTRTAVQIAEQIEDVGGYLNAYTSREMTAYYARLLEDDVDLGMELIADILRNPLFTPAEIEIERGVILQEIGQTLDTPDDIIFDWLQEVAYPDQPIGRPILGDEGRVRSFGQSDLIEFTSQQYAPGRMILAAAGAVDHARIVRLAEDLFGDMPAHPQAGTLDPARFHGGQIIKPKQLEQVHFSLAFESPDYKSPRIYSSQILASVLGGGMSSRLFQEARERRGLCYTIFAQAGAYVDTGMMTIYAGTSADQINDMADLTIDELKKAAGSISSDEVDRARAQMKAGMLMGLESPGNRAERLARMMSIWGRVPPLEEIVAKIDEVGTEDVRALAEELAGQPMAMAIYGPGAQMPEVTALQDRLNR